MSAELRYTPCAKPVKATPCAVPSTGNTRLETAGQRRINAAWLAGIIDGEGYIAFKNTPVIEVETVTPSLAYVPLGMFGGVVTERVRGSRTLFRWSAYGATATKILKEVLPYLRYKAAQARIVATTGRYPPNSAMRASHQSRLSRLRKIRY